MAVAYVSANRDYGITNSPSATATITETFCLIKVAAVNFTGTISSPSFTGGSLFLVGKEDTGSDRIWVYACYNPVAGSKSFSATLSGSACWEVYIVQFSGVVWVEPETSGMYSHSTGSGSSVSDVLTGCRSGCLVCDFGAGHTDVTWTAGADQSQIINTRTFTTMHNVGSYETGIGNHTMSWSMSGATNYEHVVVSLEASKPGGVTAVYLSDYGVM